MKGFLVWFIFLERLFVLWYLERGHAVAYVGGMKSLRVLGMGKKKSWFAKLKERLARS